MLEILWKLVVRFLAIYPRSGVPRPYNVHVGIA